MTSRSKLVRLAAALFACLVAVATSPPVFTYLRVEPDQRLFADQDVVVFVSETKDFLKGDEELTRGIVFDLVVRNGGTETIALSTREAKLVLGTESLPVEHGTDVTLGPGESTGLTLRFRRDDWSSILELTTRQEGTHRYGTVELTPVHGRLTLGTVSSPSRNAQPLQQDVVLSGYWGR